MQPEQPNTPSEDVQATDAVAADARSEPSEGSSPGWWQRMFNRRSSEETPTTSEDEAHAGGASKTPNLSAEELERRIQAEADRREYKRQADARAAARKKLRDEDPFAYAQQERQEEEANTANQSVSGFVAGIAGHHDKVTIDPLVEVLPEAERKRILSLENAGNGLEGRKLLVTESLKALEKHWRAEGAKEAETRLRRNQAFRKQVFAEFRGGQVEPELLPGSASSAADQTVSALLRSHYRLG